MAAVERTPFDTHDKPVGWAVVGLGMGKLHAEYVARSPGLRLVAICDSRRDVLEKRAKELPPAALYESLDQVLDDARVQGVSLVLPHDQHAPAAIKCLEAGRHVVLDKPFCLSVADGKKMIALARRKRRLLSVFHNRRWDADFVTIRRLVESGAIGRVRYIESRVASPGRWSPGFWRAERRHMGGLLYDWGAHLIDQALILVKSRPVSVYGFAQRDVPVQKGWDVEERMQAVIRFEDGAVALVAWMLASPAPVPRFVIEGERGGIREDREIHSLEKPRGRDGVELWVARPGKGRVQRTVPYARVDWSAYYRNIGRALAGREPLAVLPEEALRHVAVNEAAYRSARTGEAVALPRGLF